MEGFDDSPHSDTRRAAGGDIIGNGMPAHRILDLFAELDRELLLNGQEQALFVTKSAIDRPGSHARRGTDRVDSQRIRALPLEEAQSRLHEDASRTAATLLTRYGWHPGLGHNDTLCAGLRR